MPDRRTFLATAAGAVLAPAAAALAVRTAPARSAGPSPVIAGQGPRILKSLKYGMITGGATVREKFAIARDAGFHGVELDSPGNLELDDVLRAKEEAAIEVPGVVDSAHWSKPLGDPNPDVRAAGLTALERALRDCAAWGGTTVLLVPAVVNSNVSYRDAWDRSILEIRRALPIASELGVSIAIENVWNNFLLSPFEAAAYVDRLNEGVRPFRSADGSERPLVGWYFDIGNIVNYGWPEQWIDILGDRILKLDAKEFSRKKRDDEGLWRGFDAEIGEGDVDWPAVNRALDAIGYRGWASAEVRGGDLDRLKDISSRMDRVFARDDKETPK